MAVSGLGFGILSGAFSIVNVLADMAGPGTVGIFGDSHYFFLATGQLLHSARCPVLRFFPGVGGDGVAHLVERPTPDPKTRGSKPVCIRSTRKNL